MAPGGLDDESTTNANRRRTDLKSIGDRRAAVGEIDHPAAVEIRKRIPIGKKGAIMTWGACR